MFDNFRLSMTWLHTWFGLVLGYVLMACFFFGALAVFDREIDRWAQPGTRFAAQPMPSFDGMLLRKLQELKPHPDDVEATRARVIGELPDPDTLKISSFYAFANHRDPVLSYGGEFDVPNRPRDPDDDHLHVHGYETVDPRSGETLSRESLPIGSSFFYPLHFSLTLYWLNLGYWIVGLASLAMLAALVSGIVMHRKIFRELFTFRPDKQPQRRLLDLHNLTGVVALPFHFFFALTGLLIFAGIYFPISEKAQKPLVELQERMDERRTGLPHDAAGVAAPLASVDAMVAEAQRRWAARGVSGAVGSLSLQHVGDANGYVSVYRATTDRVTFNGEGIHFRASTGEVLFEDPPPPGVTSVNDYLAGLHLQPFENWALRWLYFFGGIAGCTCIATGFLFFVEKRKRTHAKQGSGGARWTDALAVTTVTGMLLAALAILVANRLLPETLPARDAWEIRSFWGVWVLALLHALWRSAPVAQARFSPAWAEQCFAVAALAVLAVVLNAVTTGDHLGRMLLEPYWPVAGVDLMLLACAVVATITGRRLRRTAGVTAVAREAAAVPAIEAGSMARSTGA